PSHDAAGVPSRTSTVRDGGFFRALILVVVGEGPGVGGGAGLGSAVHRTLTLQGFLSPATTLGHRRTRAKSFSPSIANARDAKSSPVVLRPSRSLKPTTGSQQRAHCPPKRWRRRVSAMLLQSSVASDLCNEMSRSDISLLGTHTETPRKQFGMQPAMKRRSTRSLSI